MMSFFLLCVLLSVRADDSGGELIPAFGCSFDSIEPMMKNVEAACCDNGKCPGGVPQTCSVSCAIVYSPFYASCHELIRRIFDDDKGKGQTQIRKFNALSKTCSGKVNLSVALSVIGQFRADDSTLLVPELDKFETYRYTDAQVGRQPFNTEGAACQVGWVSNHNNGPFGPPSSQCCARQPNGQNKCGRACPNIPRGVS